MRLGDVNGPSRATGVEDLLRELLPQVLGTLARRWGDFDAAEDAVQDALLIAARRWAVEGPPDNPRGWLITVASRRLTDQYRQDVARRRRETTAAAMVAARDRIAAPADTDPTAGDDTLFLLFLCCHPSLTAESQIALTLRAVGGLTTAQIASAFLVPVSTMTRRISRAKQRMAVDGPTFGPLSERDRDERLRAVMQVLYLIFNEGYTASGGTCLQRAELAAAAIRLARLVHRLLPDEGEAAGLLALMLLTDARSAARSRPDGALVPLDEQDRDLWSAAEIREGIDLIEQTLPRSLVGPYQIQAAIAAVHSEAARAEDTDWPQIVALYELLETVAPSPVVTLNHAVARAMTDGPQAGLDMLAELGSDGRLAGYHRLIAVRAHLLEMLGDLAAARAAYRTAARRTTSLPEQRYLESRASALGPEDKPELP
ncbi:RNA polymerase sigma factor [Nocardia mangyaensis]|uniref:RNA polymerase sigma factor n=1 Tax=Nocardia mangyaensis TaxID=2213200 RepID=UPI0026745287|nr:DUF6596 domain-containing protein [Nocardia mangyaensis]